MGLLIWALNPRWYLGCRQKCHQEVLSQLDMYKRYSTLTPVKSDVFCKSYVPILTARVLKRDARFVHLECASDIPTFLLGEVHIMGTCQQASPRTLTIDDMNEGRGHFLRLGKFVTYLCSDQNTV